LSPIASRGMNGASVTYTAPKKPGIMEDRFSFAVQSADGVSAPGAVTITIFDPPDLPEKLVFRMQLEFPTVFVGQRSAVEFELVNEGGGVSEGSVRVHPPWSIDGPGEYRIGARQRIAIKIVFTPDEAGAQTGEAIVGGAPRRVVALRGTAEDRLTATPPRLVLSGAVGSQTRTGVLHLANRSDEEVKVAVEAGARLLADRTTTVPARGEIGVPVFADAGDVSAFDETITLKSDHWSATIPVRVPPLGPMLRFARSEAVFERIVAGEQGEGTALIENTGGATAAVHLEIEPPFTLVSDAMLVPPKGRLEIPLRLPKVEPGNYKAVLKATAEGSEAKLDVYAEVVEAPKIAMPASKSPVAPGQPPEKSKEPEPDLEDPPPVSASRQEHPNALGAFGRAISPTSAVIDWPAKLGPTSGLRVDERTLLLSSDRKLQVNWVPVTTARLQQNGDRMRAELPKIEPATLHTVRVVAGTGDAIQTVLTVQFGTLQKPPFFNVSWTKVGLLIVVVLSGVIAFKRWKVRAHS